MLQTVTDDEKRDDKKVSGGAGPAARPGFSDRIQGSVALTNKRSGRR